MKKRLMSIAVSIAMCCSILIIIAPQVRAIEGYGVNLSNACYNNKYSRPECTWYCWGRAMEKCGVDLTFGGNANQWYDNAQNAGFAVGTTARANSIAVFRGTGSETRRYGHVVFVERVDGSIVYYTDGNYGGKDYHEGSYTTYENGLEIGNSKWEQRLIGYIYLQQPAPTPAPPKPTAPVQNLGEDFFACIYNERSDCNLENNNGNVQTAVVNKDDLRQIWHFIHNDDNSYKIVNLYDGKCLDARNASVENGTNIWTYKDNGSKAQRWWICGPGKNQCYITLACLNEHEAVMDLNSGNTPQPAGTNIHIWANAYRTNGGTFVGAQTFQIKCLSPSHVAKLLSRDIGSDFCAQIRYKDCYVQTDGEKTGAADGRNYYSNVQLTRKANANDPKQIWIFHRETNGSYTIMNVANGWYLDVDDGKAEDRRNVWTWSDDNGTNAQRWYPIAVREEETIQFATAVNFPFTSFYLDVSEGSTAEGTNLQIFQSNGTGAQKFSIVKIDPKPDTPDIPSVPDSPETPDAPDIPETPTYPDVPGYDPLPPAISFSDVASNSYFYDAVAWAVSAGIASGTGSSRFSPDLACTRAQMVTFLWRAAGSPTVSRSNPFTDISDSDYYYKAVMWAVEKGITSGSGNNKFSPDTTVTRGQVVTFLHRYAGSPSSGSNSAFTDVDANAYYAPAVRWAVSTGITNGTGNNRFSPNAFCTRSQTVTFLYRAENV